MSTVWKSSAVYRIDLPASGSAQAVMVAGRANDSATYLPGNHSPQVGRKPEDFGSNREREAKCPEEWRALAEHAKLKQKAG